MSLLVSEEQILKALDESYYINNSDGSEIFCQKYKEDGVEFLLATISADCEEGITEVFTIKGEYLGVWGDISEASIEEARKAMKQIS